jgi:hypothetical protein
MHPDPSFDLMRIRIRLFTLIRILVLIKLIRICDHDSILRLHACIVSVHNTPELDADTDQAFKIDTDSDPAFTLMRIRIQIPQMMRNHADPYPDTATLRKILLNVFEGKDFLYIR